MALYRLNFQISTILSKEMLPHISSMFRLAQCANFKSYLPPTCVQSFHCKQNNNHTILFTWIRSQCNLLCLRMQDSATCPHYLTFLSLVLFWRISSALPPIPVPPKHCFPKCGTEQSTPDKVIAERCTTVTPHATLCILSCMAPG